MSYSFLPASLAYNGQDYMGTVVEGTPNPATAAHASQASQAIPDKVRPLRLFAQSIGITRPYLLRKAPLIQAIQEKLHNV